MWPPATLQLYVLEKNKFLHAKQLYRKSQFRQYIFLKWQHHTSLTGELAFALLEGAHQHGAVTAPVQYAKDVPLNGDIGLRVFSNGHGSAAAESSPNQFLRQGFRHRWRAVVGTGMGFWGKVRVKVDQHTVFPEWHKHKQTKHHSWQKLTSRTKQTNDGKNTRRRMARERRRAKSSVASMETLNYKTIYWRCIIGRREE